MFTLLNDYLKNDIILVLSLDTNKSNDLKKLQKNFECFVIELNNNIKDLSKYEINTKEKLFNIEKYNSYNN